jgi:hypothetical protein
MDVEVPFHLVTFFLNKESNSTKWCMNFHLEFICQLQEKLMQAEQPLLEQSYVGGFQYKNSDSF